MISTTQKLQHVEDGREQAAAGCADTFFRLRKAKSTDFAKPDAEPTQIDSALHSKSYTSAQDLIDQAHADYWTL